jgi:hypothetical protein
LPPLIADSPPRNCRGLIAVDVAQDTTVAGGRQPQLGYIRPCPVQHRLTLSTCPSCSVQDSVSSDRPSSPHELQAIRGACNAPKPPNLHPKRHHVPQNSRIPAHHGRLRLAPTRRGVQRGQITGSKSRRMKHKKRCSGTLPGEGAKRCEIRGRDGARPSGVRWGVQRGAAPFRKGDQGGLVRTIKTR